MKRTTAFVAVSAAAIVALVAAVLAGPALVRGVTGHSPSPTLASNAALPPSLRNLRREVVVVGGARLLVVVAETEPEWVAGLQGVADLGPLDGELFAFPTPTETRFWMKDTLIPLDIAFFDAAGGLVTALTMPLCSADPCPTYGPSRPYRWALETRAGRLGGLRAATTMSLDPLPT